MKNKSVLISIILTNFILTGCITQTQSSVKVNYENNTSNTIEELPDTLKNCTVGLSGLTINGQNAGTYAITLYIKVSTKLTAKEFQGAEEEIEWVIENTKVAILTKQSGKTNTLQAVSAGKTNLMIIDRSIPRCVKNVPITITDGTAEQSEVSGDEKEFYEKLEKCTQTKWQTDYGSRGIQSFLLTIEGSQNDTCTVITKVIKMSQELDGTEMKCQVKNDSLDKTNYNKNYGILGTRILTECTGNYVDAIKIALGR